MFFSPRALATAAAVFASAALPLSPAFAAGTVPWSDATHDFVVISVGGGKPVPVQFDTGSVGLVIYQSGVGKGAKPTKDPATTESFPGRVYNMTYAEAKIAIAGITTTSPVKIGVVHSITCATSGCKYAKTTAQLSNIPAGQYYGILGVGFGSSKLSRHQLHGVPQSRRRETAIPTGSRMTGAISARLYACKSEVMTWDALAQPRYPGAVIPTGPKPPCTLAIEEHK